MRVKKWFYLGVPVLIGVGMLLASQPKDRQLSPGGKIDYKSATRSGRKLTPAESTTISRAIDSIGKSPPASIAYFDTGYKRCTVSCRKIADDLRKQLNGGRIQAETLKTGVRDYGSTKSDGKTSTDNDQMNINYFLLMVWGSSPSMLKYLEELMVHEWVHKQQDGKVLKYKGKKEFEAYGAELAYKDSINISHTDSDYLMALGNFVTFQKKMRKEKARVYYTAPALSHQCYIFHDTTGGLADDSLITFEFGDTSWYSYPFGLTRASDMMIFENYFPLEHCLALICGGDPMLSVARILTLDIFDGEVVSPYSEQDFPGMFFYAMTYSPERELYYMLDTLNKAIVTMADMNVDLIPETIVSTYASAIPGFEPLLDAQGVDAGIHPNLGFGLIVNDFDIHLLDCVYPYESEFFLPDYNLDNIADECISLPMYEFLVFTPIIQEPLPWEGDTTVMLYATWQHDIEVWASDSLGDSLFEMLGVVPMTDSIEAECALSRPLMAGEFIVPKDDDTGEQPNLATQVVDPTPEDLTIQLEGGAVITLRWEEIPGASYYNIYESDDPMIFPADSTYWTDINEFSMPMAGDEKLFYYVTAGR